MNKDAHGDSRQLWCYAISSKRYCLCILDKHRRPHVARNELDGKREPQCSEHGLGHLLNPADMESEDREWIVRVWETIVSEHLSLSRQEPPWNTRPALTRFPIPSPWLLRRFAQRDAEKPYAERIKPFNFLLAAHTAPLGFPEDVDPNHFLLIAPYERDPRKWTKLPWTDVHSGRAHSIARTKFARPIIRTMCSSRRTATH